MKALKLDVVLGAVVVAAAVALVLTLGATGSSKSGELPKLFAEKLTYAQAGEKAKKEGKPVFAVFSARWCGPCQSYKREALADERVREFVEGRMIPAYIDIDQDRATAEKFGVSSIPATSVIQGGTVAKSAIGNMSTDLLLEFLKPYK